MQGVTSFPPLITLEWSGVLKTVMLPTMDATEATVTDSAVGRDIQHRRQLQQQLILSEDVVTGAGTLASDPLLTIPTAIVGRLMREVLPAQARVSLHAKETIREATNEFVHFVTSEVPVVWG